jgi:hypothetical protein
METLLPGVTAERVPTGRLTVAVLSVTGRDGQAVLFVHGNVSPSSMRWGWRACTWWAGAWVAGWCCSTWWTGPVGTA